MKNANELRIGNWIDVNGYTQVRGVTVGGVWIRNKAFVISEWKGIPLTRDLAMKCGFKEDKDGCIVLDTCMYWLDTGYLQIAMGYSPLYNCPCKYLHQLQNLIFTITGKELMVDLNQL